MKIAMTASPASGGKYSHSIDEEWVDIEAPKEVISPGPYAALGVAGFRALSSFTTP